MNITERTCSNCAAFNPKPATDEAGMQALKGIAALIRTGNDAGAMGIDLVKGNREAMTPAPAPLKRRTLADFYADTGTE